MDDASVDSTLRHGRSTALFVALKENASYVYTGIYIDKINRTLLSHLQASKVIKKFTNINNIDLQNCWYNIIDVFLPGSYCNEWYSELRVFIPVFIADTTVYSKFTFDSLCKGKNCIEFTFYNSCITNYRHIKS